MRNPGHAVAGFVSRSNDFFFFFAETRNPRIYKNPHCDIISWPLCLCWERCRRDWRRNFSAIEPKPENISLLGTYAHARSHCTQTLQFVVTTSEAGTRKAVAVELLLGAGGFPPHPSTRAAAHGAYRWGLLCSCMYTIYRWVWLVDSARNS